MGRPIPRFNRRTNPPNPFATWTRPIYNTPESSEAESDADRTRHTGSYHPLALFYPNRGQPDETHIPIRQNPMYFHEDSSPATLIIPPWRRNDPAYNDFHLNDSHDVQRPPSYNIRDPRRRTSITAESPHQRRMSQIQDSSSNDPRLSSESMPEDYRSALRLVIANLVMRDIETRERNAVVDPTIPDSVSDNEQDLDYNYDYIP